MYHSHGTLIDDIEDNAFADAVCIISKYILAILIAIWILQWF